MSSPSLRHTVPARRGLARPLLASLQTAVFCALLCVPGTGRGEAMLQLFNVNWDELIQKMPEIAEAGYTSLWLPPPAKAGSVFSVGYDQFDPFDLGDKNQRGTVRTRYGTKEQLLQVVEVAHRFGIRVYFDNIMNHRGFDIPGFNSSTPTNLYPGLSPKDFHLRTQGDGTYRNWDNVTDWGNVWQVQHRPLFGLIDLANENGSLNQNFGASEGSTTAKPSYVRHASSNSYYMDTNLPIIVAGFPWRPFNGGNGDPIAEDVNAYLIRAAMWTLAETKCDGFRFDAVKHVPSSFFGDTSATAAGYGGAIQTMFDYVHGYGNNATGNGYVEGDDNRNSCFDTEVTRNDAVLFGEHLGEPPSFQEYLDRGMRLLNSPYHYRFNEIFGEPGQSIAGIEGRDYTPGYGFSGRISVLFAQSHDDNIANRRELHNAYNFMREGLPSIYSDGYNQSGPPDYFPKIAYAPYLGQFGDNKMPDVAYLHHQLARGGTRTRWGSTFVTGSINDTDVIAFERYDYRETANAWDQTVVLFAMNDNYSQDISFDDGYAQTTAGTYYTCFPVDVSRGQGLVVGFPPGSVLSQLGDSPNKNSACSKLLVRKATNVAGDAAGSTGAVNPVDRMIYVGSQALAPNGGAIELKIPRGSYVTYGYQWPEPSRANLKTNAITLQQGGADAPRITVYRRDGVNGDAGFNPSYPFKMRGSVDATGTLITGVNVSNKTYAIDVPIVTNGPLDILVRSDASTVNTLVRLDGGMDLNAQMGNTNNYNGDYRENRPGAATDVFLGYEQTGFQFRYGPEKFAAVDTNRNSLVSLGAETYWYRVDSTNFIVNGPTNAPTITNSTARWAYHNPAAPTSVTNGAATQRFPASPTSSQAVKISVRAGFQFEINRCFIYYTTDGTNNPEGAFGVGKGTTQVVEASWAGDDTGDGSIDWWTNSIPAQPSGTLVRYKIGLFKNDISEIIDFEDAKLYGLNQAAITNFNPTTATVWLHNNRNPNQTVTGLREGFHIVRARCFLPRTNKSSVFSTFAQTFYYDSALPTGVIATPAADGTNITTAAYQFVVRGDSTTTGVEFNISDSDTNNDDFITSQNYGNGQTNGVDKFAAATPVTPNAALTALYPNYPTEFRFTYNAVPTNGAATIKVRLKEASSAAFPNRFTELTRTVNTLAPGQIFTISDPGDDGMVLTLETNDVYQIHVCFSQSLGNNIDYFSIYINGVYQPRRATDQSPIYFISPGCGTGLRMLSYDWAGAQVGTNIIHVTYTNAPILSDTRVFTVERPVNYTLDSDGDGMPDWMEEVAGTDPFNTNSVLRITELANDNQLVVWDSVSNVNYQVLATTNLNSSMEAVSPIIQGSGPSAFYFDNSPDGASKFYRIQVIP